MTIGEKIRVARRLRNYTQAELGSMVNLPGDMIRKYENNVRTPKADRLAKIAEMLDIDISALSDINITSVDDILHILFELEEYSGLTVDRVDNNYTLRFDKTVTKTIAKRELLFALDSWYEMKQKFKQYSTDVNEVGEGCEDDAINEKNYQIWKMRYPLDIKANELKQSNLVQAKFLRKKNAFKNGKMKIVTFKDVILIFAEMLKLGIEIEFHTEFLGIGQGLGIFYFNNSHLLTLEKSVSDSYAKFLYSVDVLNEYGMNTEIGTHTFKNDTFTDYYLYSSQIVTMIPTLAELQQWVKDNSFETAKNKFKFEDLLSLMDIPIKDYV